MTRGMAMVLTLLVIAIAVFAGWYSGQRTDYFPKSLQTASSVCEMPGTPRRQVVQDAFESEWISGALSAFNEPSLYRRPASSRRSVRFTYLRSFHGPVVVRVDTLADGALQLTAKRHAGDQGFGLQQVPANNSEVVRRLTTAEGRTFRAVLNESGLFREESSGCSGGSDGARWIVEGADPQFGYRYRNRQSPDQGLEYTLGLHLLALTGWRVDPIY